MCLVYAPDKNMQTARDSRSEPVRCLLVKIFIHLDY